MDEPEKISIRCPGCSQRFKVGPELRNRVVECGNCENRFRVDDEVEIKARKHFPGEKKNAALERFSRMPKSADLPTMAPMSGFIPKDFEDVPTNPSFEPTSPLRLIWGFSAILIVVIVSLMLIFGGNAGGVLFGASLGKRLMLAVFTAIVCALLLLAANPRARGKAILGALVMAAGLISLPFIFTDGVKVAEPIVENADPLSAAGPDEIAQLSHSKELADLKAKISYAPMERELTRSANSIGIWLRGLQEYHKLQVRDYIVRNTGAKPSSHMYPRSPDYLLVVSSPESSIEEVELLCGRLGEVRQVIPELRVIEVEVDNRNFLEGPMAKLTDDENPAFYELNRRELESIDLERARRAIGRLSSAEPKVYRRDVTARMQQLLKQDDEKLQDEIGKALLTWSTEGDGSEDAVRAAVEKIAAEKGKVPESLVKFLVMRKDPAVIPIVHDFWSQDSNAWEELYGGLGTPIEDEVLSRYDEATITLKMSAARLLGKVGTAKSIPVLEASRAEAVPELRVFIDRALESIRARQ